MAMLTIIIPFLNEGVEVYNTVKSIRDTVDIDLNIILINDASTDEYDYKSVAIEFNVQYIVHSERKGVAASRDEGVNLCTTDYFLLLDAHMRFYQKDWASILIKELRERKNSLLCCQTVPLTANESSEIVLVPKSVVTYGAYINFDGSGSFAAAWNHIDPDPKKSVVDILCVLGATYATSKSYWLHLKGLSGLKSYGKDEELISLKVWLEGGKCILLKNIEIGHIYRSIMPYEKRDRDFFYNLLLITELFLPDSYKEKLLTKINKEYLDSILTEFETNKIKINKEKTHYKKIFKRNIDKVLIYNKLLQEINGFCLNYKLYKKLKHDL